MFVENWERSFTKLRVLALNVGLFMTMSNPKTLLPIGFETSHFFGRYQEKIQ